METFTWCPRVGAQGTTRHRTRSAQFGDGYAQVSGDPINAKVQSWPLTFTQPESIAAEIRDFLDRHRGYKAFFWTPPLGELSLWRVTEYNIQAVGAGMYNISATFEQAFRADG